MPGVAKQHWLVRYTNKLLRGALITLLASLALIGLVEWVGNVMIDFWKILLHLSTN